MKRDISVEITSKYISLTSNFIGRLRFTNPNQIITYLNLSVSPNDLGKEIRKKLIESKEVSEEEFMLYWNNRNEHCKINELEENKIISHYKYKNKQEFYKDTLFLSVSIFNSKLFITPYHQDGLGTYGTVIKDGKGLEFEYPVTIILSPEELGKAVMEAFEYSTSIYK